ncbi:MAG: arylsulfatase [Planctomycetaceae bacterium]|nr:arylsulfatase [Planctomycetaceae bacterium]
MIASLSTSRFRWFRRHSWMASLLFATVSASSGLLAADRPNIVVILADDLGYGDLSCLNSDSKLTTPNWDRLSREGMTYLDAHTPSAVCTPTRYGLLTGRYCWRSKLKSGVLGGLSPRLIEPGRETMASFLQSRGYHTGCVGKWHLGMEWVVLPGKSVTELSIEPRDQVFNVDYSQPVSNGPLSVGFDEYFGISASLDMVPYAYLRNDRLTAAPTEDRGFLMMHGREDGPTTRQGPAAPGFDAASVLPDLAREAVDFLERAAKDDRRPFFLYVPLASPHTPILPTAEWQGRSGLNPYGDFVLQTDWAVGEILATLDRLGISDSTLVVATSDNGCSPQAQFPELLERGHNPNFVFRGHKADLYEGGHRVPFLVRWPGHVPAGASSRSLVCLTDVFATVADVLGEALTDATAEDSFSFASTWSDASASPRKLLVSHSIDGSFAIRDKTWKLLLCPGSGGWSEPRPNRDDTSEGPLIQLFDLVKDIGETRNVQAEQPEIVSRLIAELEQIAESGRSRPGERQSNTTPVDIWAAGKRAHQPVARPRRPLP